MSMKAMSVHNPWAWALCVQRPRGGPLKGGENRTQRMPRRQGGQWTLIHCGKSHRPTSTNVKAVVEQARRAMLRVPIWATRPVGAIIGAVCFDRCISVEQALQDRRLEPWVNPKAHYFYVVRGSVLFPEPRWLRCKGKQSVFWSPSDEIVRDAAVLLESSGHLSPPAAAEPEDGACEDGDPKSMSGFASMPIGENGW